MSTLAAAPPLLTAEEFADRYPDHRVELVKGVVKTIPMLGLKHGIVCMTVGCLIANHVKGGDFGRVSTCDSWVKVASNPDTVRGADVCFFSYERLPKGKVPDGLLPVAPDLVVEVRSPSDRWKDVIIKVGEYLEAGVRAVVVLDPPAASATVYRADEFHQTFHNGDELTLPDVLPGFAVPVSRLFA